MIQPSALDGLLDHLRARLSSIGGRALLSRWYDDGGPGDATERGYRSRVRSWSAAGAIDGDSDLLCETFAGQATMWIDHVEHLVSDFVDDLPALRAAGLVRPASDRIAHVSAPLGDRHDGGRYVLGLETADGDRIVYKPRSLALEAWFFRTVSHVNQWLTPTLAIPRLLDMETRGWMERVPVAGCAGAGPSQRLSQRLGSLLWLLHATAGTDMHGENIVISGEHPVPVDLECLFTPALVDEIGDATSPDDSLLSVGLLATSPHDPLSPDLSVLGWGTSPRRTRIRPRWVGLGTGAIDCRPHGVHQKGAGTRTAAPIVAPADLIDGFEAVERVVAHRGIGQELPRSVPVRVVLRPTEQYGEMIARATMAGSFGSRERFQQACTPEVRGVRNDDLTCHPRVLDAERSALTRFDVPRFWTNADGFDLHGEGSRLVADAFARTGVVVAQQRRLRSPAQRDRDLEILRASCGAAAPAGGSSPDGSVPS